MDCQNCGKKKVDPASIGDKCFACDVCKKGICEKCAPGMFSASEVRVLQLKKERNLIYACSECYRDMLGKKNLDAIVRRTTEEVIEGMKIECNKIMDKKISAYEKQLSEIMRLNKELTKIVEDTKNLNLNENSRIEKEILELKNLFVQSGNMETKTIAGPIKTYSQAVNQEVIVVKPRDEKQSSSNTKKEVENKVDPADMGVGISKVKYINKGGVAIKCFKGEGKPVEKLCVELENKLGDQYEVKKLEKSNPKIKIFNVFKKDAEDDEELIEKLVKQNALTGENHIKIERKYTTREERFLNVIVELDARTYLQLKNKETINIGWKVCRFINYINIVQCFKCNKFGHIAKYCRSDKNFCRKCADNHQTEECKSSIAVCSNCKYAAEVLKIPKIDYKHYATDKQCPVYMRVYNSLQERINCSANNGTNA